MPFVEGVGNSEMPLSFPPDTLRRVDQEPTGLQDKVILHDLATSAGQLSFISAARTRGASLLGDSSLWSRSAPEEVVQELLAHKIFQDTFVSQLKSLAALRGISKSDQPAYAKKHNLWENSVIAEFPWRTEGRMVRLLPEPEFREVTFSRTRFVFPDDVLLRLKDMTISCAGMGVGAGILEVLARLGAQSLRFCDGGMVELKDNNRLIGGDVHSVSMNHAQFAARMFYGINPYAQIEYYDKNIDYETTDNTVSLKTMVTGASIFLEEIDNLLFKKVIRESCREHGVLAVFTGTDTACAGSISIERPNDKLFHGRMSGMFEGTEYEVMPELESLLSSQDQQEHVRMAMQYIVGMDLVSPLFQEAQERAGKAGARYFVQPPISARVTSALVATAILMSLQGVKTKPEVMVDLYQSLRA